MKLRQSQQTLVTLANATELVQSIVLGVVGNEVADTFDGNELTRGVVYAMAQTKFQSALSSKIQARSQAC